MRSVFAKYFVPFLQWYLIMIIIALFIDYLLHRYHLEIIGRYMGLTGTLLLIVSFIYSLRKRKIISEGSPKTLLQFHEYIAWLASVLLLVHAGIHFSAILPWIAIFMLLIVVASGLIGKFLLKKSAESFKNKKQELISQGIAAADADKKLFFDAITVDMMKKWRDVHLPITLMFAIFALMHIISILMFSK